MCVTIATPPQTPRRFRPSFHHATMPALTESAETYSYTTVELLTLAGPEYRRVAQGPTRPATADEIPVIDLEGMWYYGDAHSDAHGDDVSRAAAADAAKARAAAAIRAAATGAGFFYVANHGIPETVIAQADAQARRFFAQPSEDKMRAFYKERPLGNGYAPVHSGQINRSETKGVCGVWCVQCGVCFLSAAC